MITDAGVMSFNPPEQTHMSGTAIDIALAGLGHGIGVTVIPNRIGLSDHHMVIAKCHGNYTIDYSAAIGRVKWSSTIHWGEALCSISHVLSQLGAAVESLTS